MNLNEMRTQKLWQITQECDQQLTRLVHSKCQLWIHRCMHLSVYTIFGLLGEPMDVPEGQEGQINVWGLLNVSRVLNVFQAHGWHHFPINQNIKGTKLSNYYLFKLMRNNIKYLKNFILEMVYSEILFVTTARRVCGSKWTCRRCKDNLLLCLFYRFRGDFLENFILSITWKFYS